MSDSQPAGPAASKRQDITVGSRTVYLKIAKITAGAALTAIVIIIAAAGIVAYLSQDRLLPNTRIAGVNFGLAEPVAATQTLQQRFDTMIDAGLSAELDGQTSQISLRPNAATDPDLVYQLLDWDVAKGVDLVYQFGRGRNQLRNYFSPLYHWLIAPVRLEPNFTLAETRFLTALREDFGAAESAGRPTDFVFSDHDESLEVTVTEAVAGVVLDTDHAMLTVLNDASDLELETLQLRLVQRSALISKTEAETLMPQALAAIQSAPYSLNFEPEYGQDLTYFITANDLKNWLLPGKREGSPALMLDLLAMQDWLNQIHTAIDLAPQDAKFVIEGDRVIDFQASRDGFLINDDSLLDDLLAVMGTEDSEVMIATERTAANLPTGQANDLGIKKVLGVGYSSFAGSPTNRRANIRHGASKLNGILIPPGETLSLLEKLRPFTVADGYLPELVIKGDEIIPEVGGGLCQIGTTTFRAAMNSGLEIVERRNHSLVVTYYNDPANGNPGTDATIYDPAPDLKIQNDTVNYIMLTTRVESATNELYFTFWGTSDGRQGTYTPPLVLNWVGVGEPIVKDTTALAPGVKSCQSAHPGATATFDYNIAWPDGSAKTRSFLSSYRPLPSVCLVGIEPIEGSDLAVEATPEDLENISDAPLTEEQIEKIIDASAEETN